MSKPKEMNWDLLFSILKEWANNSKKLEELKKKTYLLYSERKKIAKEYEEWCKINNAMINDTTNMTTWFLCFKLKEWLENEYNL